MFFPIIPQFGEGCGGLAGVNGFRALPDALFQIDGQPGSDEGCGSVQQNDVAPRAGSPASTAFSTAASAFDAASSTCQKSSN